MTNSGDNFIAPSCQEQISFLFQDEHLLLINKPSGLLSLSGKNPLNKDSVHFRLVKDFPRACLAHRLDFGTSGVMLIALSKAVNALLTKQFQNRTIVKTYTSILMGTLAEDSGEIVAPIAKDTGNFPLQKICADKGKHAVSHYQVLAHLHNPSRTRVAFTPITGRTHQLRIHSKEIGHPILGCDLYGTSVSHAMAERLLLHADSLGFEHPITGRRMTVHSPCPF